jgi:hypothetical protein
LACRVRRQVYLRVQSLCLGPGICECQYMVVMILGWVLGGVGRKMVAVGLGCDYWPGRHRRANPSKKKCSARKGRLVILGSAGRGSELDAVCGHANRVGCGLGFIPMFRRNVVVFVEASGVLYVTQGCRDGFQITQKMRGGVAGLPNLVPKPCSLRRKSFAMLQVVCHCLGFAASFAEG